MRKHPTRKRSMPRSTAKQKVLAVVEKLPPNATFDDALERLVLLAKIERGVSELDSGKGVHHTEAERRLGSGRIVT